MQWKKSRWQADDWIQTDSKLLVISIKCDILTRSVQNAQLIQCVKWRSLQCDASNVCNKRNHFFHSLKHIVQMRYAPLFGDSNICLEELSRLNFICINALIRILVCENEVMLYSLTLKQSLLHTSAVKLIVTYRWKHDLSYSTASSKHEQRPLVTNFAVG